VSLCRVLQWQCILSLLFFFFFFCWRLEGGICNRLLFILCPVLSPVSQLYLLGPAQLTKIESEFCPVLSLCQGKWPRIKLGQGNKNGDGFHLVTTPNVVQSDLVIRHQSLVT
jgi:hypothetical protein